MRKKANASTREIIQAPERISNRQLSTVETTESSA